MMWGDSALSRPWLLIPSTKPSLLEALADKPNLLKAENQWLMAHTTRQASLLLQRCGAPSLQYPLIHGELPLGGHIT